MNYKKLLMLAIIMVISFVCISWLLSAQPLAQADGNSSTPLSQPISESPSILASPQFIGLLWPIAFVVLSFTLNTLATNNDRANGSNKFKVQCVKNGNDEAISPVSILRLESIFRDYDEVKDIEVLSPGFLESFNIGVDLCVGAISTDLAIIFTLSVIKGQNYDAVAMATTVSALILHFITASLTVLVIKAASNSENPRTRIWLTQAANLLGIMAIFTSFYILGSLVAGTIQ